MKTRLFGAVTLAFCLFFATGATAGTLTYGSLAVPNGVYFGSGNQNAGFTVFTEGNLELGLSAVIRYQGLAPESNDNYYVPIGQTTQPGKAGSTWGVNFSVNTRAGGGSAVVSDYTYLLTFFDGTNTTSFNPIFIPDNSHYDVNGARVGFQNSEPGSVFPGFDINALDTYKVTLSAWTDPAVRSSRSSVSILVNAQETPEPATLGLIGTALLGLGLGGSRRSKRSK